MELLGTPGSVALIDLRSNLEYKRAHIDGSINIPFTSLSLGDVRLEALNVENLVNQLNNKVVVVASTFHENAILVRTFKLCILFSIPNTPFSFCSFRNFYWNVAFNGFVPYTKDSIFFIRSCRMCWFLHRNENAFNQKMVLTTIMRHFYDKWKQAVFHFWLRWPI